MTASNNMGEVLRYRTQDDIRQELHDIEACAGAIVEKIVAEHAAMAAVFTGDLSKIAAADLRKAAGAMQAAIEKARDNIRAQRERQEKVRRDIAVSTRLYGAWGHRHEQRSK